MLGLARWVQAAEYGPGYSPGQIPAFHPAGLGSTYGTRCLRSAPWRCSRLLSFFAFRLARSNGLSSTKSRPLWLHVQVLVSPVRRPGRLLYLDKIDPVEGANEKVDLIDTSIVRDELEI
jgi:hypothetical protein